VSASLSPQLRRIRLLAFALGTAGFMFAFFHRVAPGAIAADLREAYQLSATTLGFVAALYFYPYALMQLPSGVLADTIGPRKLFTGGMLVAGVGSLLFAYAPSVAWLLAGRGLVGFGVAVVFVSVLKLIANWFRDNEFGTWVGVLQLLGNLGAVLGAWPLAWAVQVVSWSSVFAGIGVASIALAAALWFWVQDAPPGEASGGAPVRRTGWAEGIGVVARNPQTWAAFLMHFGILGSYMTFAGLWAVPYLTDGLGYSRSDATLHVTVMILGFAVCAPVIGTLSDRTGLRRPFVRGLTLLYLACWVPVVLGWKLPFVVSLALFALVGATMACSILCWAIGKEVNPPALAGTATSFVNTGGFLGAALLQPAVGWILDASGDVSKLEAYCRAAGLLAMVAAVGVGAAFGLRETRCGNVYR